MERKPYIWYGGMQGEQPVSGTAQLTLEEVVDFIQEAAEEEWASWSLFTSDNGNPADLVARIMMRNVT